MFSKKATKIDEIFTVDLALCSQIDGEDFVNFRGLLRKCELYCAEIRSIPFVEDKTDSFQSSFCGL